MRVSGKQYNHVLQMQNLRSNTVGYSKSKKVIQKIEKGKGGVLYGCVDLPEGEYGTDEINARVDAQAAAFTEQYQTTSMGDGDGDGPTNADPYPTQYTKADLQGFGFGEN
jgi:hypothetical protein